MLLLIVAPNPESWTQLFIQLWDVIEDERTHIPAGKFSSITRKVSEHSALDSTAKLTFEVSDDIAPMQFHKASMPLIRGSEIHVALGGELQTARPLAGVVGHQDRILLWQWLSIISSGSREIETLLKPGSYTSMRDEAAFAVIPTASYHLN